ncbi:PREDICTED: aspartate aminotransferase-like [Brassica oleracea var. oleracea]|uniref:aspartate aminotransferase-like n=1 Tax=Brassica oleracea var. oleracea TaxID=109376 RepID=UPI0006A6F6AB|nr:PREDICTED: aspartate aminotransferase-like [Brassica oleracea var. oleracea]
MNRTLADFQAAQQQQAAINAILLRSMKPRTFQNLRGGRTMSSSSVITPEDVLESLMNDGTIDALRLKIINQLKANAFVNLVLALCDPGDSVVMFQPYYFNAYMAFQMTGVTNIIVGPGHPDTLYPGADWLEKTLSESKPTPKVVTVVNPGNPSGTYVPEPLLKRISKICEDAGCWLIVDNTYEYFMYDGLKHCCVEGDNIVNVFSFSKTYGMMGWRLGYMAYSQRLDGFAAELLKIQDNIPICASIISQRLQVLLQMLSLQIHPSSQIISSPFHHFLSMNMNDVW